MEKTVFVKTQLPAATRSYTRQNGEQVTIKNVNVVLTDGIDTFVAEAGGRLADQLEAEPLDSSSFYRVQCNLEVYSWTNKDSKVTDYATRVRIIKIAKIS
ncbi:MAG: hypothetical protein LIR46_11515 [Bacteroidota bacterium]|nr:hypothetical protein [Bacteroidota bacterium]